jgi:hypothetical protein
MDFLRNFKTELDAKTEFGTTDSVADLRHFCRDGLRILKGVRTGKGEGPAEHSSVDSRNRGAECKEL